MLASKSAQDFVYLMQLTPKPSEENSYLSIEGFRQPFFLQ